MDSELIYSICIYHINMAETAIKSYNKSIARLKQEQLLAEAVMDQAFGPPNVLSTASISLMALHARRLVLICGQATEVASHGYIAMPPIHTTSEQIQKHVAHMKDQLSCEEENITPAELFKRYGNPYSPSKPQRIIFRYMCLTQGFGVAGVPVPEPLPDCRESYERVATINKELVETRTLLHNAQTLLSALTLELVELSSD
jgi:hypothetical protein